MSALATGPHRTPSFATNHRDVASIAVGSLLPATSNVNSYVCVIVFHFRAPMCHVARCADALHPAGNRFQPLTDG